MPTSLGSSVLVIDHPHPERLAFGVDHCRGFEEAKRFCAKRQYSLLVAPATLGEASISHLLQIGHERSAHVHLIVVAASLPSQELLTLISALDVLKVLPSYNDEDAGPLIIQALEQISNLTQESQYLNLVHEKNQQLSVLQNELEERVAKRQRYLYKSRQKLLLANERDQALQAALIAIQRATSVSEMETYLNEALVPTLYLRWTRIFFMAQESIFQKESVGKSFSVYNAPLYRHNEMLGNIYFLRDRKNPFNKSDMRFLNQTAEAASLGLDRILKADEAENFKQQWEATFNAIIEPLCILDSRGLVLQWNAAFEKSIEGEKTKIFGRSPNDLLFSSRIGKSQISLGENSRIRDEGDSDREGRIFDVYSQRIQINASESYYVNIYYNVTDQERMEHQLLESAKMAELGTIGSSIAHELNNPLGGMISFIQLIKMDLPTDDPFAEEINEMEKGAKRCKEIVQNLLGFSRMDQSDKREEIDLRDVIRRSTAITDLQTRSRGIKLTVHFPATPCPVTGQLNTLSQAVKNLIQNAYEAISEKKRKVKDFKGEILITLEERDQNYLIQVKDNGLGIDPKIQSKISNPLFSTKDRTTNPGLGLSVASQIFREHQASLDFDSKPDLGTTAKVLFSV